MRRGLVLYFAATTELWAQADTDVPTNFLGENIAVFNPLTSLQFWALIIVVFASIFFFSGQIWLLKRSKCLAPDDVVKNCTITMVITSALILIVAGYSSQQTAQAFGLFGTIVGYLLGKSAGRNEATRERSDG